MANSARVAAAIACAGVFGGFVFALLREPAPRVPPPPSAHAPDPASARFGPGEWTVAPGLENMPALAWDTEPPAGPHLESGNRLRIDKDLHALFDYFLLGGHPGTRPDHLGALRQHLEGRLPAAAVAEASDIAQRYVAYLDEHDREYERMQAREAAAPVQPDGAAPTADVDRIGAWVAQRARLRQTMLGMQVAQAWFGEEEQELQQVIAAMRSGETRPAVQAGDPLAEIAASLRELHAQGAALDVRREQVAAQTGEPAARRYETMEREEQVWQSHFESYRRQAQAVRDQAGVSEDERARQIESLLAHAFPDEAQRLRARALDGPPL